MTKPVVIFGASELAEVADFYFNHDTEREVAAFTADGEGIGSDTFCGKPLVPFEELAQRHPPDSHDLFVAIGYSKLNQVRADKCAAGREKGYALASYVSSKATIWPGFEAPENAFILEDNTLQPFVRLGAGITLWSGNHIGHHAVIGDFCFITSHVVVSGGVTVGDQSFIGVNASLGDHITIGRQCMISAGAIVTKDVPDQAVMAAEPAEQKRVPSTRIPGFGR